MSHYVRRPLSLPANPIALFEHLAHQSWAMLLDSAVADLDDAHPDACFDILVADPRATVITRGDTTWVQQGSNSSAHQGDPLQVLAMTQNAVLGPQLEGPKDLPFIGGALGHFSYDLGRRFERLPALAEDDIGLAEMAVGIYDWALVIDQRHYQVELVVLGDEAQWQERYHWLVAQLSQEPGPFGFALKGPWQHQLTEAQYRERFEKVQAYLASGDCYQINLTQRFSAPYGGNEWDAYKALRQHNLAPFSAYIRLPDAVLLSLSPERFLLVEGTQVQTKPIKGTRPRFEDPAQDAQSALALQQSPKDRAENLMIVDLLRNDLGRIAAPGSVRVPALFAIESFPAVHHLVSTVTATLADEAGPLDLLRSAFPGGSITGAPKIRAMEIIEELEPNRRSLYCGSIGYLSQHGRMDTSITIRTLVAREGQLHCWAGGGIVADSQCEAEYQESFDKVSRILPLLNELKTQKV
ncbi:aminodeoxychorismate synthase component I [Ferrimonas balearica]|uniref:aminodeoxychorismate synthase component I n=1 Tax=Ferrimonas balearica TaxID=44012 RepID=UPI001C99AC29|nr:aminodeoxychorismate synthase component I [Ferrimonas balearica]MBY5991449.1 aminodeoxychorismate synthase component I [Ferrimonas balearica]